jgi:hypothetical protein
MTEIERARSEAAEQERGAILAIIERYSRHLSHGHGVTGAHVLQHIIEEIEKRQVRQAGDAEEPTAAS